MTPTARISLDGRDITTRLFDGANRPLATLTITDEAGIKSDTLELEIDDREHFPAPPVGSEIQVWLGFEPAPVYMGRYRVDEWTKSGAPRVLRVSAKSAELTTEIRATKVRSWHDTTLKEIVQTIAGENGLSSVMDGETAGHPIEHIDQHNESDVAFLTRLASRHGATFKVADGKVLFVKRGSGILPSGKSKGKIVIRPADVSTWSVTQSERGGHKSVVTQWHDHDAGKRKSVRAGSGKPTHRDRHVYRTEAEARAAADAKLGALTRGKREGQFDGVGNPALYAEGMVTLEGFDDDADGTFFLKSVTHSFSASGYTTSASLETEKSEPEGE